MSNRPTAIQLLDRLREIHEARLGRPLSDEKLAGQLPISLSTLNRWKKGDTKAFREIVTLLDEAGWLTVEREATPGQVSSRRPPPSLEDGVANLLMGQSEELEILQRIEAALESAAPAQKTAVPQKKAASRRKR